MFRMTFVLRTACVLAMATVVFAAECRAQSEVMPALYPDPDVYPDFDYREFIKELRYPEAARRYEIEAELMVETLVLADGSTDSTRVIETDCVEPEPPMDDEIYQQDRNLGDVLAIKEQTRITRNICSAFSLEAMRAVRMSRFTPAYKDGKPIPFWIRIPIIFKLR